MALSKIKDLLEKYVHIKPKDKIIKEAYTEIIKEIFHHTISTKDVSVTRNILYVKTHPTLKHEIHLRKHEVICLLNKKLRQKDGFIKDVR